MNETEASSKTSWLQQLIQWREKHLTTRQFMVILSFMVGMFAALAALLLHSLISWIEQMLTSGFNFESYNWLYLVFPIVGVYLTSLFVKYVVKDDISHGITRILYAISRKKSRIKKHNCWSSVFASALTIGFGGSVGAEAPIVLTGSAIGSNLGQLFRLDGKMLMVLVGCGASAAIAGIFKAPIAGLVFTLEVLMIDLTMASLLPILIASVTATCFTYFFIGGESLFTYVPDREWNLDGVPAMILLGVACGLVSLYFIRMMTACEGVFARLKDYRYARLLLGAAILSTLIFLFPSLYGEGYSSISVLINGSNEQEWNAVMGNSLFYGSDNLLILYIALVLLTKVFATSATNGAGGCGGTFAPSLFIGAFGGFLFSRLWNMYDIGPVVAEKNFTLLGMAGVMAGVMHAPLTGIFLIAELTGGYNLFIPLIIVSICAYLTIIIFEPHSIYGMRLAREGKLITHHTDHSVLTLMRLESVVDRHYESVDSEMTLGDLVHSFSRSKSVLLPVLDSDGQLLGEIDFTKIRHVVFRTELYHHFNVSQLMTQPPAVLGIDDNMLEVMKTFERTEAQQLPVCDMAHHLVGYVNRARMYAMYRRMVADLSTE